MNIQNVCFLFLAHAIFRDTWHHPHENQITSLTSAQRLLLDVCHEYSECCFIFHCVCVMLFSEIWFCPLDHQFNFRTNNAAWPQRHHIGNCRFRVTISHHSSMCTIQIKPNTKMPCCWHSSFLELIPQMLFSLKIWQGEIICPKRDSLGEMWRAMV